MTENLPDSNQDPAVAAREISAQAIGLEESMVSYQLLRDAIRLADLTDNRLLQYSLRRQFKHVAQTIGMTEDAIVAFAWCLNEADNNPELAGRMQGILWNYSELAVAAIDVTHVSREQIDEMVEDYAERTRKLGFGQRCAYHLRWRVKMRMARFEEAVADYEKWKTLPSDAMCFARAANVDSEAELMVLLKRDREAFSIAEPILNGSLSMTRVIPAATYGNLLVSAIRLRDFEQAKELRDLGWPLHSRTSGDQVYLAWHILYFVWLDEPASALPIFEEYLPRILGIANMYNYWHFVCASEILLLRLQQEYTELKLHLPNQHPLFDASGTYQIDPLREWFQQERSRIGKDLDRRNGNEHYQELPHELTKLVEVPPEK